MTLTADVAPTVDWVVHPEPTFHNSVGLSRGETTVLCLSITGADLAQMQRALLLPQATVQDFVRSAYRQIGAADREQAQAWALAEGLLTPVVRESGPTTTAPHAA